MESCDLSVAGSNPDPSCGILRGRLLGRLLGLLARQQAWVPPGVLEIKLLISLHGVHRLPEVCAAASEWDPRIPGSEPPPRLPPTSQRGRSTRRIALGWNGAQEQPERKGTLTFHPFFEWGSGLSKVRRLTLVQLSSFPKKPPTPIAVATPAALPRLLTALVPWFSPMGL